MSDWVSLFGAASKAVIQTLGCSECDDWHHSVCGQNSPDRQSNVVCPWRDDEHRQVCEPGDTTRRFGTASSLRGSILADTTCRATVRSSRKARCLKTPHPAAVAAPTDKRGFVTPKFREQCASTHPRFRAGWAYPQGWPHVCWRVFNIPPTRCA